MPFAADRAFATATDYRIDDFQQTYFVLDNFKQLFEACYGTDFAPLYREYASQPPIAAAARLTDDRVVASDRSAAPLG